MSGFPISRRAIYPLLATTVWAVAFCAYYFVWISRQQVLLTNRAYRLLAITSDQIKSKLDSFGQVLAKNGKQFSGSPDKFAPVPELEYSPCDTTERLTEPKLTIARDHIKFTVPLKRVSDTPIDRHENASRLNRAASTASPTISVPAYICAVETPGQSFGAFIDQIPDEIFDEILIASQTGLVIYQRSHSGVPITNLQHLIDRAQNVFGKSASPAEKFTADNLANSFETTLADHRYRVLATPAPVEVQGENGLIVCGLVLSDKFLRQAVAIPFVWLVFAVFLVLSLSWPILKLMSPEERLRPGQVRYLKLWIVVGAFLCTLLVLHAAYFLPTGDIDRQLKSLADRINANLADELDRGLETVASFQSSQFLRSFTPESLPPAPHNATATDPCTKWPPPDVDKARGWLMKLSSLPQPWYPYFDLIYWADGHGYQRIKWSVHKEVTPSNPLCQYAFFQDVLDEKFWTLNTPKKPQRTSRPFTIQPLYSPNTGQYLTTIAQPTKIGPLSLVALVTPLISVVHPVVPPGFGYAIIDAAGVVQFHSTASKNATENFFRESENDGNLRASVLARSGKYLTENYLGVRHRLYVTPLESLTGSPWSLVVFYNLSPILTMHMAAFLLFSLLSLGYALLLLLTAAVLFTGFGFDPTLKFRPGVQNQRPQFRLLVVYLVILLLFVALVQSPRPDVALFTLVGFPVLAVVILPTADRLDGLVERLKLALFKALGSRPAVQRKVASRPTQWDWIMTYCMTATLLTVIVAIIPCMALFRLSFDFVRKVRVKQKLPGNP